MHVHMFRHFRLLREGEKVRLLCANCGDSRAVLCRNRAARPLSKEPFVGSGLVLQICGLCLLFSPESMASLGLRLDGQKTTKTTTIETNR